MILESDDSCSMENSMRIYDELKKNDKNDMHSMQVIEGVDHLYFTWVSNVEFVDSLAAIVEK